MSDQGQRYVRCDPTPGTTAGACVPWKEYPGHASVDFDGWVVVVYSGGRWEVYAPLPPRSCGRSPSANGKEIDVEKAKTRALKVYEALR